ncbi:MAG: DciA family protein [Pyrinomonadaceae bacterium]
MDELFKTLPAILERFGDDEQIRETIVFAAWRRAAGDGINEHAVPVAIENSRLTVAVAGKAWKRHLEDLAGELVFKINRLLSGESVTFIEFVEDAAAVSAVNLRTPFEDPFEAAEAAVTPELRRAAVAISDPEMRRKFLLAAGSCIAREARLDGRED